MLLLAVTSIVYCMHNRCCIVQTANILDVISNSQRNCTDHRHVAWMQITVMSRGCSTISIPSVINYTKSILHLLLITRIISISLNQPWVFNDVLVVKQRSYDACNACVTLFIASLLATEDKLRMYKLAGIGHMALSSVII
jgi:hypothetical protein